MMTETFSIVSGAPVSVLVLGEVSVLTAGICLSGMFWAGGVGSSQMQPRGFGIPAILAAIFAGPLGNNW